MLSRSVRFSGTGCCVLVNLMMRFRRNVKVLVRIGRDSRWLRQVVSLENQVGREIVGLPETEPPIVLERPVIVGVGDVEITLAVERNPDPEKRLRAERRGRRDAALVTCSADEIRLPHSQVRRRVAVVPRRSLHRRHRKRREKNERPIIVHVGNINIAIRIDRDTLRTEEAVSTQPAFVHRIRDKTAGLPEHRERRKVALLIRTRERRERIVKYQHAVVLRIADVHPMRSVNCYSDRLAKPRSIRRWRILIASRRIKIGLPNHQVRRPAGFERRNTLPPKHAIILRVRHEDMASRLIDSQSCRRVQPDRIDEVHRNFCEINLPEHAVCDYGADPSSQNPTHRGQRKRRRDTRDQYDPASPQTRAHAPSFSDPGPAPTGYAWRNEC